MLNASARSKAKLPIVAMWGNPDVFFQKPTVEATVARQKDGPVGHWGGRGIDGQGRERFRKEAAAGARPPAGLKKRALLCALGGAQLVVALADFVFCSQPIFGFVPCLESATLRK